MKTNKKSTLNQFAKRALASAAFTFAMLNMCQVAAAATINWKGHVWDVTGVEPIGAPSSGQINGDASNVSVDANGYLHLKITKIGNAFTGAQLFTQDNVGFGTYNFQIEGDLTNFERGVVLGIFPYGPTAGIGVDGENEIDIEFSKWDDPNSGNNADFTYYPPTGHGDANYTPSFEHNFFVNFGGATLSTSRIEWTPTSISSTIMTGLQPVGILANVISPNDTYTPSNPTIKIPQVALPVGLNLWTYGTKPTKALDIVIRDFQFVPRCTANCSSSSSSAKSSVVASSIKASIAASVASSVKSSVAASVASSIKSSLAASSIASGQQCNWWGTIYPICKTVTSGWGWENNTDCVSASTCATLSPPYGIIGSGTSSASVAASSVAASSVASSSSGVDTNIAPTGTGATWSKNTTATANTNKLASNGVIDNNLSTDVVVNPAGEGGTVKYEAAGVTWTSAKTISSVKFINGNFTNGDGIFGSGLSLQYTTNGTTWAESGWTVNPAYPYSSAASGVTYTLSGASLAGVTGVRVSGRTSATAWFWSVKEVQAVGH